MRGDRASPQTPAALSARDTGLLTPAHHERCRVRAGTRGRWRTTVGARPLRQLRRATPPSIGYASRCATAATDPLVRCLSVAGLWQAAPPAENDLVILDLGAIPPICRSGIVEKPPACLWLSHRDLGAVGHGVGHACALSVERRARFSVAVGPPTSAKASGVLGSCLARIRSGQRVAGASARMRERDGCRSRAGGRLGSV
jgi:hypothetical protein